MSLPTTVITRKTNHQAAREALVRSLEEKNRKTPQKLPDVLALRRAAEEKWIAEAPERERLAKLKAKEAAALATSFNDRAKVWRQERNAKRNEERKITLQAKQARRQAKRLARPKKTYQITRHEPKPQNITGYQFYGGRNSCLKGLGFSSYEQYLASRKWHKIRARTFAIDEGKCRLCGAHANAVHHTAYNKKTLLGTDFTHLHSICHPCHTFVEFDEKGEKRTPYEMMTKTQEKLVLMKNSKLEVLKFPIESQEPIVQELSVRASPEYLREGFSSLTS